MLNSKYLRFLPNLQRSLIVMLKTMDNVAVFFGLLMLFIFIFSILGMNLFGCRFCDPDTGTCERKNFDSLLWALVTVFQVFMEENTLIHKTDTTFPDSHSRGLEHCVVLWNGENKSLGSIVLHPPHDFWQLCPFQPPSCHSCRGFQVPE